MASHARLPHRNRLRIAEHFPGWLADDFRNLQRFNLLAFGKTFLKIKKRLLLPRISLTQCPVAYTEGLPGSRASLSDVR
jgi:hypothetical protein